MDVNCCIILDPEILVVSRLLRDTHSVELVIDLLASGWTPNDFTGV